MNEFNPSIEGAVADQDARFVRRFLASILSRERDRARAEALSVVENRGVAFFYEEVVPPALAVVGELWERDEIDTADEHVATAVVQSALAWLDPRYPWPEPGEHTAIVGCAPGERHEVGARTRLKSRLSS